MAADVPARTGLAGCLLGVRRGLGVGIASPLFSFAVTSLAGNAMPAAARLPFMIAELAMFAVVSGLFSKKIYENGWAGFPRGTARRGRRQSIFPAPCRNISSRRTVYRGSRVDAGRVGAHRTAAASRARPRRRNSPAQTARKIIKIFYKKEFRHNGTPFLPFFLKTAYPNEFVSV